VSKWKIEYYDTVYKVYDWNKNLAGYFFPEYRMVKYDDEKRQQEQQPQVQQNQLQNQEAQEFFCDDDDDESIDKLTRKHGKVRGGNLMIPMLKLNILDNQEGIELDYVIGSLEQNLKRARIWKHWLEQNQSKYNVIGSLVYTAREDRNMLSILLGIDSDIILEEKEICKILTPLLNKLHQDALL
jgi:hypothetical protein